MQLETRRAILKRLNECLSMYLELKERLDVYSFHIITAIDYIWVSLIIYVFGCTVHVLLYTIKVETRTLTNAKHGLLTLT